MQRAQEHSSSIRADVEVQDDKAAKSGLAHRMMRLPKVVWRSSTQQTKYAEVMKLEKWASQMCGTLKEWDHRWLNNLQYLVTFPT